MRQLAVSCSQTKRDELANLIRPSSVPVREPRTSQALPSLRPTLHPTPHFLLPPPLYPTAQAGDLLTSSSCSYSLFCREKGWLFVLWLLKWDSMRAKSVQRDVTGLTFATYKPWMSHPPKGHNCRYCHIRNPQPAAWRLIQSTSGPSSSSRGRGPTLRRGEGTIDFPMLHALAWMPEEPTEKA